MAIAVLITVGIFAAIIILSNLSNIFGGATAALMSRLIVAFPPQPEGSGGVRSKAAAVIQEMPDGEPDPRRPRVPQPRIVDVIVSLDDNYMHLRHDVGVSAGVRRASIPWNAMTLRTTAQVKHFGEAAEFSAGAFVIRLPAHLVVPYVEPQNEPPIDVDFREVSDPGSSRTY